MLNNINPEEFSRRNVRMRFISLVRFKGKPTKKAIAQSIKCIKHEAANDGIKILAHYWTLGRYDSIIIIEAPDEQAVLRMAVRRGRCMSMETLVAIPVEEARKLV